MNIIRIVNDGIVILPMSLEHQRLWRSLQQRMFLLQLNHTNCKQMGHNLIFFIVQMGATGLPRYTFNIVLTQPSYQMLLVS